MTGGGAGGAESCACGAGGTGADGVCGVRAEVTISFFGDIVAFSAANEPEALLGAFASETAVTASAVPLLCDDLLRTWPKGLEKIENGDLRRLETSESEREESTCKGPRLSRRAFCGFQK